MSAFRNGLGQIGVSNSEAMDASSCMRKLWFAHHPAVHLAPRTLGPALSRGIVGHKALENFYSDVKVEKDYDQSAQDALNYIQKKSEQALLEMDEKVLDELNRLHKTLEMYFEHYRSDIENWEILGVEDFHLLEWEGESSVYLPMRLDLVVYQRGGKFKGEISPVDHKFTNNFWDFWKFRLNSQLPLNMLALRASKFKGKAETVVKRSVVNQIRTRNITDPYASELFRRSFIEADETAMRNIFENHLKIALRVAEIKRLPPEVAFGETSAVWGSSNCQFCHFKPVCATQLEGGNVDSMVAAEYQKSTYGYPSMEELKNER